MAENGEDEKRDENRLYSLPAGAMCAGCEIVRPLGAGTYGEVYLAIDPEGRYCAIKRMQLVDKDDQKSRRRFLQEAGLLKYIEHPNVVKCHAYEAAKDGTLSMRLDYLRGANLRELLHARGRFPLEQVLRLGPQACAGLGVLHEAKAVHRDVKPENLFLVTDGELLKVLDFGLVKLAGSGLKTTGRHVLGTALYFAPDYLERNPAGNDDAADVRWDIYSLGITLYELLVGHPFVLALGKMPAPMVAAKMHLVGEIPHLGDLGVPKWAADPIMQAVARDPDDRPASAAILGRMLIEARHVALREKTTGTIVPRTASARVRLATATTEPDVVQHLTRAVTVSEVVRERATTSAAPEASTSPAATVAFRPAPPDASASPAAPVAFRPSPPDASASPAAPVVFHPAAPDAALVGPQGTTRMIPPPVFQRTPPSGVEPRGSSGAPVAARAAPPSAAPPPQGTVRTEPLDRDLLRGAVSAAGSIGAVPRPAAPASDAVRRAHDNVPPTDDEAARDAAEIAVWLDKGYLPADVAAKLGLRAAPVVQASSDRSVVVTPKPRSAPSANRGALRSAASWIPRWVRWETVAKPLAVLVTAGCVALATYAVVRRIASATPPRAEAIDVPLPPPNVTPQSAVPPETPREPAGGPSASAVASASATASARVAAGPPSSQAASPKPKSTRSDDIYPTPWDDPLPKTSAAPKAASAPAAAPKPSATPSPGVAPPKAAPAGTSVLPFGKTED